MMGIIGWRGRPTKAERAAAAWLVKLQSEQLDGDAMRAFERWRSDPRNAEAYARTEAVWSLVGRLPETAEAGEARRVPRRRQLASSVVVSAVATCAVVAVLVIRPSGTILQTGVGQVEAFRLADGSSVTLDSGSRARVRMTSTRRLITLERGRLIASVERDPRPFEVVADETEVRALGTVFMVSKLGQAVEVGLLEGRVSVRTRRGGQEGSIHLTPGQSASFAEGHSPKPETLHASDVAWAQRRLRFDGTPLRDAVTQVNRYSQAPLVTRLQSKAQYRISGSFDLGDSRAFAHAAAKVFDLKVLQKPDGTLELRDEACRTDALCD